MQKSLSLTIDYWYTGNYSQYMKEFTVWTSKPQGTKPKLWHILSFALVILLFGSGIYFLFAGLPQYRKWFGLKTNPRIPKVLSIGKDGIVYKEDKFTRNFHFASSVSIYCIKPDYDLSKDFDIQKHAHLLGKYKPEQVRTVVTQGQRFIPTLLMGTDKTIEVLDVSLFDCPKK
jgi:hypothetical protein